MNSDSMKNIFHVACRTVKTDLVKDCQLNYNCENRISDFRLDRTDSVIHWFIFNNLRFRVYDIIREYIGNRHPCERNRIERSEYVY